MSSRYIYSFKRDPNRALVHIISHNDLLPNNELNINYYSDQEYLDLITKSNWVHYNRRKLLRGDIIQIEEVDLQNEGTFIYDGINIIKLSTDINKNGTLPEQFHAITEFPPTYWEYVISNTIIWLPNNIVELFMSNIKTTSNNNDIPSFMKWYINTNIRIEYSEITWNNKEYILYTDANTISLFIQLKLYLNKSQDFPLARHIEDRNNIILLVY